MCTFQPTEATKTRAAKTSITEFLLLLWVCCSAFIYVLLLLLLVQLQLQLVLLLLFVFSIIFMLAKVFGGLEELILKISRLAYFRGSG